ncbi:phosphatase PAP2 family protein [Parasedimentitalea psychrophila]|uniref:Phosphatase PAP2 family protein n=1 Tax=Parasedimentitalea psychrophila TaxID=2997337 RepID=A0A9Y2L6F7_9RHOB|nr:phosphatase PAP2 family protein [Parasedimentitalea psychrophila]WIY27784.1 phosphatase PAP2 family protein [Parasedimentitalea psychrophila]
MFRIFGLTKNGLVLFGVLLSILCGRGQVERTGDYLQIALPVAAFACSVSNGEALNTFLRFVLVEGVVHGTKRGLDAAPINHRPGGGLQGFPSGHTAAATFGVSSLVNSCVKKNPWVQGAVILSGGYVGASRIEVGAHFLFQVVAGALLGWLGERSSMLFRILRIVTLRRYRQFARRLILTRL